MVAINKEFTIKFVTRFYIAVKEHLSSLKSMEVQQVAHYKSKSYVLFGKDELPSFLNLPSTTK